MEQKIRAVKIEERYLKYRRYYAGAVGCENGSRNKMEERYLKYRHYYAGIDILGLGGYGKAVYAPLSLCLINGIEENLWMIFPAISSSWRINYILLIIQITDRKGEQRSAFT